MPIRTSDIFSDPTLNLRAEVNPFLSKLIDGQTNGDLPVIYGPALKPYKDRWMQAFPSLKGRQLILEIGSHTGKVITEMAENHPETNFVGMDITFKRVVLTAQKAKNKKLENMISILANAKGMKDLFGDQELDGIVVFFPDPWEKKKKQHKNRLINKEFCENILEQLKPGGFLWFKTDHRGYFDEASEFIFNSGFLADKPLDGITTETYQSIFEKMFEEKKQGYHEGIWRKPTR